MALNTGTVIEHYKIASPLGIGGMGEVYLAEDVRLERKVAVKILPSELVKDKRRLLRFEQEARAVSSLNHPNIITLHEIGQIDDMHYLVTEFVEGETLRQRLNKGAIELMDVLDIAIQICNALAAAHAAGIIHRDIKPDNVMLRPDGYVKILDFGIAKLTEKSQPQEPIELESENTFIRTAVTTEPGIIIGSPNYMSPEQARGLAVDERTDIFSLGVMLYEMIAGRRPFEGETVSDLIVALLDKEPPPLHYFAPDLPERFTRTIKKALAKKRSERHQHITEMLTDLRRVKQRLEFEAGLEPSLPPEPKDSSQQATVVTGGHRLDENTDAEQTLELTTTRSGRRKVTTEISRRAKRLRLAVIVVCLLGAITVLFFLLKGGKNRIDSVAVLPLVNISGDESAEYLSDGITESLINNLSRSPKLRVMSRNSVFQYKGQTIDPREVGKKLGVDAILTGRIQQRGDALAINIELINTKDNSQVWGQHFNRKLADLVMMQEEIARQVSDNLQLRLSNEERQQVMKGNTDNVEAYQLYLRGRYQWNKRDADAMERGIEYFKKAIELDPNYACAYAGLADCYALLGEYERLPIKESLPLAKAAAQRAIELDSTLAEAHTSLAAVYEYEWNWGEAEKEYKLAIEKNPNYATAYHWYGIYLSSMRRFAESELALRAALNLDPLSPIINTGLGRMLWSAGRYDEAVTQLKKTLEVEPEFAEAHFQFGLAYEGKREYQEAAAEFQKAVELFKDPAMRGWVAREYALMGKVTEAQKIVTELQTLSKTRYVSPYMMAISYAALGDRKQTADWLERVFQERSYYVVWLKVDPIFDAYRHDANFQDLLRRIGLN